MHFAILMLVERVAVLLFLPVFLHQSLDFHHPNSSRNRDDTREKQQLKETTLFLLVRLSAKCSYLSSKENEMCLRKTKNETTLHEPRVREAAVKVFYFW